ncbi:hypothetical protein T8K17_19295 [Thalassobaculum sp. OXR-137]|uniref:hypothetical protein n=1 Tax=Thalassobaculum sp. OXR-137 TaxID=3100173 RepID=UPI002AC986EC|nr:hypothetical protein [Thalassobaculum sp. OXR-137]WPZ33369.1 hypothetical protein T8K17_19295 [Thalassobaculum sp. OXR-137]
MITALLVLSPAAHTDQTPDRFEKLVARSDYRTALWSAALLQKGLMGGGCFSGSAKVEFGIVGPADAQFVDGRVWPVSGVWHTFVDYRFAMCPDDGFRAKFSIIAHPQATPIVLAVVPGRSASSYRLKTVLHDQLTAAVRRITEREDCPYPIIMNSQPTQFLDSAPGITTTREVWTVRACDRVADFFIDIEWDPTTQTTSFNTRVATDETTGHSFREIGVPAPIYEDDGRLKTLAAEALSEDSAIRLEARKALQFLADSNVPEAQYHLAVSLAHDPGGNRKLELEGLYWAARSTANGSADGAHLAGKIVENGPHLAPPDLRTAALLYRRAEEMGASQAAEDYQRLVTAHPWLPKILKDLPIL